MAFAHTEVDPTTIPLRYGRNNDAAEVKKLQRFLNKDLSITLPITGHFGLATEVAVKKLQTLHASEILDPQDINGPTGIVLNYTMPRVNKRACIIHSEE